MLACRATDAEHGRGNEYASARRRLRNHRSQMGNGHDRCLPQEVAFGGEYGETATGGSEISCCRHAHVALAT